MDIESYREYCLSKKYVTEGFPFDNVTLVFKVAGKMFAIASLDDIPPRISLKCDPVKAIELREQYEEVIPGYHLNKKLWNTITIDGIPPELLIELTDYSYDLIIASLTKKKQRELGFLK
jgi:predicted DNA-binding protein (MmcQ/YjbR family)